MSSHDETVSSHLSSGANSIAGDGSSGESEVANRNGSGRREMAAADTKQQPWGESFSTQLGSITKSSGPASSTDDGDCGGTDGGGGTEKEMAKTWCQMFKIWPYRSFLIVVMEFSLSLTALNNVFNLYYINVLEFSPDSTVIILNIVAIIGGFVRLFGSIISDSYLGKFRAVFFGSCIYIVGKLIITTSSFLPPGFPHPYLDFGCQLIILAGASTMSPSIAPFGADQFEPHQEKMISLFYSVFYASINIGAMISNIMMPILRAQPCFGKDSCYPLSFSVSTIGVILSFVFFVVGSKFYVRRPPKGNMFSAVYGVVRTSWANKATNKGGPRAHWLDYYFDTHTCELDQKCLELRKKEGDPSLCQKEQFVDDFRCLLRLLIVFIPMPMFWALYDQQYNVWMNQALLLDCRIWGDFRLLPDQMQVVNPVLIIILICAFQSCIYPCLECCVLLTPLRKMVAGGVIAAIAFFVSGGVQLMINPTLPDIPAKEHAFVSFVNTLDNCTLEIRHLGGSEWTLKPNSSLVNDKRRNRQELFNVKWGANRWTIQGLNATGCPARLRGKKPAEFQVGIEKNTEMGLVIIDPAGNAFLASAETKKPTGGAGQFKVGVVMALEEEGGKGTENGKKKQKIYEGRLALCRHGHECNHHTGKNFYAFHTKKEEHDVKKVKYVLGGQEGGEAAAVYPYIEVRPGRWTLHYLHNEPKLSMAKEELQVEPVGAGIEYEMEDQGGVYALIVTGTKERPRLQTHQIVPANDVSVLWQLPQIFIISVAEILVSITGMEFAYSQSGASMKTIAFSCWSMTNSLGAIIITVITLLPIENLATKAFIYAGLMLIDVYILATLASCCYEYRKGTIAALSLSSTQSSHSSSSSSAANRRASLISANKTHPDGAVECN